MSDGGSQEVASDPDVILSLSSEEVLDHRRHLRTFDSVDGDDALFAISFHLKPLLHFEPRNVLSERRLTEAPRRLGSRPHLQDVLTLTHPLELGNPVEILEQSARFRVFRFRRRSGPPRSSTTLDDGAGKSSNG
jgi:hypothetical protein